VMRNRLTGQTRAPLRCLSSGKIGNRGCKPAVPNDDSLVPEKCLHPARAGRNKSRAATADPLGFSDRGLAIFEDLPGVDQER
jgi:hypothetical protein